MGRPSSCNTCCPDVTDDPAPVSDCGGAIAVVFIDETNGHGTSWFNILNARIAKYLDAYPDRLLFIMDFVPRDYGSIGYGYLEKFRDSKRCFSLAEEKRGGQPWTDDIPEWIYPDQVINGNSVNPPAGGLQFVHSYITTIVNNSSKTTGANEAEGDIVRAIWEKSTEVSVFRDNSGSMRAVEVETAYEQFKTDLEAGTSEIAKKSIKHSLSNKKEDFICPFVFEQCCSNEDAAALMVECNNADDGDRTLCKVNRLIFSEKPESHRQYLVDDFKKSEYCDNLAEECSDCPSVSSGGEEHTIKYTAAALQDLGGGIERILTWPKIKYNLQYRDSEDETWKDLGYSLPSDKSSVPQSLDVLLRATDEDNNKIWVPQGSCVTCHPLISQYGVPVSSCDKFEDYSLTTYVRRVFKREFRIEAVLDVDDCGCAADGLDPSIVTDPFQLYQHVFIEDIDQSAWDWEREFTTTTDGKSLYNFPHEGPAIGKVGDQTDKLIISRFDMTRTNDTSGPYAFGGVMTRFKLCPVIVSPELRVGAPGTQRWYGFQRLLVASEQEPSDKGSIQHYVAGSPGSKLYASKKFAREGLQGSSHWFFEDRPFILINDYSAHEGSEAGPNIGYTMAPTSSKDPRPGCGSSHSSRADVPTGFWFMEGTKLTLDETYGYQYDGLRETNLLLCSTQYDYGYLINSYSNQLDGSCNKRQTFRYDLGVGVGGLGILSESDTTAQIATDGNGDTVAVSAPYPHSSNKTVSVLRTFGGLGHWSSENSIQEIFSTDDHEVNHWAPTSLCLNDAGNVLGYTYRDENTTTNKGHVAIWDISGGSKFSINAEEREVVGLPELLGYNSNLSVLRMDKSGNNIIVSCTRGKVTTDDTDFTGWAQVFTYSEADKKYIARGQRLEGTVTNGQFGIDCDISSDGQSVVVSSCERNENSDSQNPENNRHGAIRCYTWKGEQWEQLGETIRGTNYWSNLGFHLSYEADHVKRIAAFEGTNPDSRAGAISMYKLDKKSG